MQCPMSGPGVPCGHQDHMMVSPGARHQDVPAPALPQVSHTLPRSLQMIGHPDQIGDIINFLSPEISGSLLSIQSGE